MTLKVQTPFDKGSTICRHNGLIVTLAQASSFVTWANRKFSHKPYWESPKKVIVLSCRLYIYICHYGKGNRPYDTQDVRQTGYMAQAKSCMAHKLHGRQDGKGHRKYGTPVVWQAHFIAQVTGHKSDRLYGTCNRLYGT